MVLQVVLTALAFSGRCKVDQPTVWTFDAVHSRKISGCWRFDVRTEEGRLGGVLDLPETLYEFGWTLWDFFGINRGVINKVLTSALR